MRVWTEKNTLLQQQTFSVIDKNSQNKDLVSKQKSVIRKHLKGGGRLLRLREVTVKECRIESQIEVYQLSTGSEGKLSCEYFATVRTSVETFVLNLFKTQTSLRTLKTDKYISALHDLLPLPRNIYQGN